MSSTDLPKVEDLKINDDYQTYKLGTFALKSGGEIPDAFIAYKTLGDPSLPAIIYPTVRELYVRIACETYTDFVCSPIVVFRMYVSFSISNPCY
jgi:hypothetical protein